MKRQLFPLTVLWLLVASSAQAQEKTRVYFQEATVTSSMIDFHEQCPELTITSKEDRADYTVHFGSRETAFDLLPIFGPVIM